MRRSVRAVLCLSLVLGVTQLGGCAGADFFFGFATPLITAQDHVAYLNRIASKAQTAHDALAQRLAACAGAGPILDQMQADINDIDHARQELIDIIGSSQDAMVVSANIVNKTNDGTKAYGHARDKVDALYDVAAECGVVDPTVTSEAQWRSTWWDVSSP